MEFYVAKYNQSFVLIEFYVVVGWISGITDQQFYTIDFHGCTISLQPWSWTFSFLFVVKGFGRTSNKIQFFEYFLKLFDQ